MSEIITCPDCDTQLKMKAALPPGKKVRCPKCSTLFAPVPEEEVDTPVSKGRRNAAAEREEEDERPRRRPRSTVEEEDSDELEDEERPRRSRKKRPRKNGNRGLIVGLVIGGLLLLLVGIGIVVAVVTLRGRTDPYKETETALKEMVACFEEFATVMESIKDPQSAKAGTERINKVCDRMEKATARLEQLPKLTSAQNERLKNEIQPRIDANTQRMARVAAQVRAATQRDPAFQAALQRFQQIGNKLQRIGI